MLIERKNLEFCTVDESSISQIIFVNTSFLYQLYPQYKHLKKYNEKKYIKSLKKQPGEYAYQHRDNKYIIYAVINRLGEVPDNSIISKLLSDIYEFCKIYSISKISICQSALEYVNIYDVDTLLKLFDKIFDDSFCLYVYL